jgi:Xaa-Pro aminopeptidase
MTLQKIVTTEFDVKQARINALLSKYQLDGLLLQKVSSFAWATCGAGSYVNTANGQGEASLLILPTGRYLITNNIEAPRLEQEENLGDQNWEFCVVPWYEVQDVIGKLAHGINLGGDGAYKGTTNLALEMTYLRAALTSEEDERFKTLGCLCAEAMNAAVRSVRPGLTEFQIAARLAQEAESRGVQAVVNLIATDGRISNFRHPLPTSKKLEKYAMLILCGRQRGLICSITRFIHFGRLSEDVRRKAQSVAEIDAILINATRPDQSLSEIFQKGIAAYAQSGYPFEWTRHHQGGLAGYEPREVTANPNSNEVVSVGQAYAWNPSIPGTKSEDTILVGAEANEIITAIPGWPMVTINVDNHRLERPMILEMA